ncbi:unnamed protein product [Caretta caretta]
MKTQKVASKLLQHSPRKVDLAWNNLQAFLSLSPNVLQRLAFSGNSDPVFCQGSYYHVSCANFWLNCVDSSLPREPVTLSSLF